MEIGKAKSKLAEYAATHENELYELVKSLARIPAPTGKEEKRAQFCLEWLKAHDAENAYIDGSGNVIFPYRAKWKKNASVNDMDSDCAKAEVCPLIVFDAHMDVVFPDETELPLMERDGRIYCPGVGDDTANLAVLLMMAVYAAKEQPDTGKYGILFVCGVGEEGLGNLKGVREICRVFGDRICAFYALDLAMDAYTSRAVGSRRYRIVVQTAGGHSYSCFGNTNANVELAGIIQKLYSLKVPQRGKTTYNVGMISGGTSVNTIAQSAEMLYEIRSDDVMDLEEMRRMFEAVMEDCGAVYESDEMTGPENKIETEKSQAIFRPDCRVTVELIGERPCEKDVDEVRRQELFRLVQQVVGEIAGAVPVPKPGSTDCNIPLSLGIPSVCVGTCRGAGAHTREEYIEKDSLGLGLQIGLELLEKCVKL